MTVHNYSVISDFTLAIRTKGATKEEVYESYEAARAAFKVAPFGSILSYKVSVPPEDIN